MCVNFWSCRLTLVSELKKHILFQHVLLHFPKVEKIFRDLERVFKSKKFVCKIFQRYCKDIYYFTEMNKPKNFKNLFKIFMTVFENLGFLKMKKDLHKDFSKILSNQNQFLSNMIKDGKYLLQKIHQGSIVIESK